MGNDEIFTVIRQDGSANKESEPDLSDDALLRLLRTMIATRALNERGMNLQRQGRINFYIGSEGQEAVHIGAGATLRPSDWYFPHYRDAGVALWRGATIESMVHQLFGDARDPIKGRQMPNHYSYKDLNFFSISSPLTTQVPQAVGAAYAMMYRGEDKVAMTAFGDGSTSEGDFHVALNFAGVWKAPVVFLCENNQWAISVPVKLQTASSSFAIKAAAYGFDGIRVDGNDILAMYEATRRAVDKARGGGGPTLIEGITYRMGPHSSSDDPKRYVPTSDLDTWRKRDPIQRFESYLARRGIANEKTAASMRAEIDAEIDAAVKSAESTPMPPIESIVEDVFGTVPWHLTDQLRKYRESLEE
ncbi:MAG: thiamine pyrophosphate-dependent dehydrogenase E1 component subunit alpha [Thermoplasmatota archaeon]